MKGTYYLFVFLIVLLGGCRAKQGEMQDIPDSNPKLASKVCTHQINEVRQYDGVFGGTADGTVDLIETRHFIYNENQILVGQVTDWENIADATSDRVTENYIDFNDQGDSLGVDSTIDSGNDGINSALDVEESSTFSYTYNDLGKVTNRVETRHSVDGLGVVKDRIIAYDVTGYDALDFKTDYIYTITATVGGPTLATQAYVLSNDEYGKALTKHYEYTNSVGAITHFYDLTSENSYVFSTKSAYLDQIIWELDDNLAGISYGITQRTYSAKWIMETESIKEYSDAARTILKTSMERMRNRDLCEVLSDL